MLKQLHNRWWKILCVAFLVYTFTAGLLIHTPDVPLLHETVRNLFFHVPCWFSMLLLMLISLIYSIKFLRSGRMIHDVIAVSLLKVAMVFGVLGYLTGMLWGNFIWGDLLSWITNDTKILGAAIGLLIYFAYFILRGSIDDEEKRARVAAVYSIFAFILLNVSINVVPRLTSSLHPGSGGNATFTVYDLDNNLRMVFYPAVFGYTLLGLWISSIIIRMTILHYKKNDIPLV
ncbi:MAG TPA: cytochrome c biogenesis protein CcsA [Chitinophagales bacterium]|nr:cytochrome c biogenesis protein CcsA [Chitinophagales bacterium]HMZ89154.1 cytochrome c biogenesis protein CcsA [Chitinophagales bacterium]HNA58801.1 cytochrome c biogenesis protein CcsA [Chitinophagales bacterium]HNE45921.1 cytochrome c biogenesis protein CcsA [Chitinophagales bacterium]HNF69452.1 cytochrome c biogenesis protein CcsA [Chitinophagales bacterium]